MKYFSTITIFLLAFAQTTNAGTAVFDGASGLVPIQLTRIKGDPAIGVHHLTLPGENPGDKDGFMRYMALAYINTHPEILDHERAALGVATLFLTTDTQKRFIEGVGAPVGSYTGWKGDNEFQVERTRRSFVEEFGSTLADSAPISPFEFWVVTPATLGPYDFDQGGYKMYGPNIAKPFYHSKVVLPIGRSLSDDLSLKHQMMYINISNEIIVPKFMPMTAEQAEKLTNYLAKQSKENRIYYSAHMRVLDITTTYNQQRYMNNRTVTGFVGGIFFVEFRSLALYADPDLTYLIHQYDAPTPIAAN